LRLFLEDYENFNNKIINSENDIGDEGARAIGKNLSISSQLT